MFLFLKYIQPTWYYNLSTKSETLVMIDPNALNSELLKHLSIDKIYSNVNSTTMDAIYQAILKGAIPNKKNAIKSKNAIIVNDINDNYRFIRKYFALYRYCIILIIRIFCLYNPLIEIKWFIRNLKVKRIDVYKNHFNYNDFKSFKSKLVESIPLVSIIIPTLNRYDYLKDVLSDLEKQTFQNFEILICDQSEPVNEAFYQNWNLDIKLIIQEEKALWLARNKCIKMAKGDYILLFDDDSRVETDWIEQHLKCLDYFQVDISAGITHTLVGQGLSIKESYFHLSDVFDTGNSLVHKKVFEKVGLFDRQFEKQRMGDGEFGLRAFLGGFQLISNPFAKRIHLKVESGGLREMGSWDAFRPKHFWSPRPIPSTLYLSRKYFGNKASLLLLFNTIPRSLTSYKFKGHKGMKLLGLVFLPFYFPIVFFQVFRSWQLSSVKLNEGNKIAILDKE